MATCWSISSTPSPQILEWRLSPTNMISPDSQGPKIAKKSIHR
jgi:hypothetical protein